MASRGQQESVERGNICGGRAIIHFSSISNSVWRTPPRRCHKYFTCVINEIILHFCLGVTSQSTAMAILVQLRNSRIRRSKSARKLAAYVLSDPEAVLGMSAATVAAQVGVSEPTVGRFCKSMDLKGFPDFKLQLAAELARQQPRVAQDIEADDSVSRVIAKIFDGTRASLDAAQTSLDYHGVEQAAAALDQAHRIVLFGLGASAPVANDTEHKLLRFSTPVVAVTDAINQRMVSASLSPRDCVICISYTGRTILMEQAACLARDNGAVVIGITTPLSPLRISVTWCSA